MFSGSLLSSWADILDLSKSFCCLVLNNWVVVLAVGGKTKRPRHLEIEFEEERELEPQTGRRRA